MLPTRFQDLQDDDNPRNGETIADRADVVALLQESRAIGLPFMCQLTSDHGFNLIVGIAGDFGCVQHASNDGQPPYLMAVSNAGAAIRGEMVFLVADTATPIDGQFRITFDELCDVVGEFVATGERSVKVSWEQFA